ncbi:MAG: hypothetical protein Q7K39_05070 [Candidatus Magasanikbacteria bacterium]|nr:hypothetical protein [Candidatus Magasanikbacteria bacterium]
MIIEVSVIGEEVRVIAGKMQKIFFIRENLSLMLAKLKMINGLKFKNGSPIYDSRKYGSISLWSFFQDFIFWKRLYFFVRFSEVIKFITEQKYTHILVNNRELAGVLQMLPGLKVKSKKNFLAYPARLVLKVFGFFISHLAILILWLRKTPYLVYSPDIAVGKYACDFRLTSLYEFLMSRKIKFQEIFHTNIGLNFIRNFVRRWRGVLYLESLVFFTSKTDFNPAAVSWPNLPDYERFFLGLVLKEVDRMCNHSAKLIKKLIFIFKYSNVKKLAALDDMRYTNELIIACRENSIATFGFQHGQFTKYHIGWMHYDMPPENSVTFDTLFVWNSYWQNILCQYSLKYTLENTAISGAPKKFFGEVKKRDKPASPKNLLILFESFVSKNEIQPYINRLLDCGFVLYLSLRPDLPKNAQLQRYGLVGNNSVQVVSKLDAQIISELDAVVGVHSTLLSELMYYDLPVFQIESSFDLGHQLRDNSLSIALPKNFTTEYINSAIDSFQSKKNVVWPSAPSINETYQKIFS